MFTGTVVSFVLHSLPCTPMHKSEKIATLALSVGLAYPCGGAAHDNGIMYVHECFLSTKYKTFSCSTLCRTCTFKIAHDSRVTTETRTLRTDVQTVRWFGSTWTCRPVPIGFYTIKKGRALSIKTSGVQKQKQKTR